ncbi:MAG TPA: ABC transporter permease subunit [Candidatus Dormibacteraeota bacterium]|nr:ABC transporter permease subunit [Candidatus Dormibacteraeota bacterium]
MQRLGIIGMAFFGVVGGAVQAFAFNSAAGTTEAARQAFAQQMTVLGQQISYLLPVPVGVDTIGGYLQWRVYGGYPFVVLIWAVLSASGATRGDEEKGLVEVWLAKGVSRLWYVLVRFAAFGLAAMSFAAGMGAAVYLGAAATGNTLDLLALVEISVAMVGLILVLYAIGLVLAQLVSTRGAAAGLIGGVLTVLFLVNSLSRTVDSLRPIARVVSPFYYYDLNTPLRAGGTFDVAATAGLFGSAVVLAVLAAVLMQRRDLGSALIRRRPRTRPPVYRPDPNPLLRFPVVESLYEHRVGLLAWTLGTAIGAAYFASVGKQIVDLVTSTQGSLRAYLALVGHHDLYVSLTGFFWFGFFQLILAIYAITQVARWASEDNEGRLEMELSAPVPRWRVVLERAVTLLVSLTILIGVSSAALYVAAHQINIEVPSGDLFIASLALIPFGTTFGAVGAALASRVPRATVAVLVTIAGLSYLLVQIGPILKWPDWVLKLSVFTLYGNPLTDGVKWDGLGEMLTICVLGFGLATILMQRREVGR